MQKRWPSWIGTVVLAAGLAGCQCCPLTDHYASVIDTISDHEHGLDALYHPCHDLTRIGRPDWCQCGVNRLLCPCRCHCTKPLPHIIDTTAGAYVGMNCPWETNPSPQPADPNRVDDPHSDSAEKQLSNGAADQSRDDVSEEVLDEFPPQESNGTSLQNDSSAPVLWDLDR